MFLGAHSGVGRKKGGGERIGGERKRERESASSTDR